MNFLKKFETPKEFSDDNFIEGLMRQEKKTSLESFKEKKVTKGRARAKTTFGLGISIPRRIIIYINLDSSVSKTRLSILSKPFHSLFKEQIETKRRNTSVKI